MKKILLAGLTLVSLVIFLAYTTTGKSGEDQTITAEEKPALRQLSSEFNNYWYAGDAEITSYKLEQARYGEVHSGNAVLVFVTEPFSKTKQVKADAPDKGDVSVMKLNATKKFNTGIYPYSMMTSTFVPVKEKKASALKVTTTSQEWCGHTFMQLNNRKGEFQIQSRSYFESEGDQDLTLGKSIIEDELWTKIRLNPAELPEGQQEIIPSFFYLRLKHKPVKAYKAVTKIIPGNSQSTYEINYPDLDRTLSITFNKEFPYEILQWEESYSSGWGPSAKSLTTKATRIKTLKTDYWTKHNKVDLQLRKELGL